MIKLYTNTDPNVCNLEYLVILRLACNLTETTATVPQRCFMAFVGPRVFLYFTSAQNLSIARELYSSNLLDARFLCCRVHYSV